MATAEDNIQVANVTTAGQLFHLLRRQMHRDVRKPLIVFTPKSLLRAKESRSAVSVLTNGKFEETMLDLAPPSEPTDLVFATGKVAYDAMKRRTEVGAASVVTRVEQLYPWPHEQVGACLLYTSDAADE